MVAGIGSSLWMSLKGVKTPIAISTYHETGRCLLGNWPPGRMTECETAVLVQRAKLCSFSTKAE